MKRRVGLYSLLAIVTLGLFGTAIPGAASVKGRRNTAIAATGAAVYELARGHTAAGLVLGAGSYYAWKHVKAGKRHHQASRVRHVAYRSHRSRHHHLA